MDKWASTPQFEENIRQSFGVPPIRPEFVHQVHDDLLRRAVTMPHRSRPTLMGRRVWTFALVLGITIVVSILVIGPERVMAAVGHILGYLPQVGVVEQGTPIRMLAKPVSVTREGITVTVEQAYLTSAKTVVVYRVDNVPWSALSHSEDIAGCAETANLELPDGQLLQVVDGWGTGSQTTNIFPAISANIQEAHFGLPCLMGTLPSKAPANWELVLHFIPAPPELTAAPVINIPTSTSPAMPSVKAFQSQPTSDNPFGIQIVLDQALPLSDGYYLIGHVIWKDDQIASASLGGWSLKAYDTKNQEIPLEPADFGEAGIEPQAGQWIYRLYGKAFLGSLTLRTSQVTIEFAQPVSFELDPHAYGFDDNSRPDSAWKIDPIPLDILNQPVKVVQIRFVQLGEMKGFELGIEADPKLLVLPFNLESEVHGGRGASGGGSNREEESGSLLSRVLSDGQMTFPLSLVAHGAVIAGHWETSWAPPQADFSMPPTPVPQACLTLTGWKQALHDPLPLPSNLPMEVLLGREALAPELSLFLARLDGSYEQGLAAGQGSLSPDATRLVYADRSANLQILDRPSGKTITLTTSSQDSRPVWSPDGQWIAFLRLGESRQIFVIHPDGTGLKAATPPDPTAQLAGWFPEGGQVLYWTANEDQTATIRLVDPVSDRVTDLFLADFYAPSPAFSPDGGWIAYLDRVPGRMADGLYLAHPDGSQRRLLVQLDHWPVSSPVWSPYGKWLGFNVLNTDLFQTSSSVGLLNVETCQVIPLPNLNGSIREWVKP